MTTIKDGYNSEPTDIIINGRPNDKTAEIWIKMTNKDGGRRDETLHYATIEEIKLLRDECNQALKEMLGLPDR